VTELARLSSESPHTFTTFELGADLRIAVLALADRDRDLSVADRGHPDLVRPRLGADLRPPGFDVDARR
jgi:hypothetical protein